MLFSQFRQVKMIYCFFREIFLKINFVNSSLMKLYYTLQTTALVVICTLYVA